MIAEQPNTVVIRCNMKLNFDGLLEKIWEKLSFIQRLKFINIARLSKVSQKRRNLILVVILISIVTLNEFLIINGRR